MKYSLKNDYYVISFIEHNINQMKIDLRFNSETFPIFQLLSIEGDVLYHDRVYDIEYCREIYRQLKSEGFK